MKLKAADNLAPIRNQIIDLIQENSKVIEFGCGNGNLLFELSPKIKYGLGIDKSKILVNQARQLKKSHNFYNINFLCEELGSDFRHPENYDVSVASLFFHVIARQEALYLLEEMTKISDNILICGFSRPQTQRQKLLLWCDQRFSNHYGNFLSYQKTGYLEGLLKETSFSNYRVHDTILPFVKIYRIVQQRATE